MPPDNAISLWSVLTAIMFPLFGGGFVLLWGRLEKHQDVDSSHHDSMWDALNKLRTDLEHHRVDSERRFVKTDDLRSLEERLDSRLSRIEDKIDAAISGPAIKVNP